MLKILGHLPYFCIKTYVPAHDKANKMACAPCEDSDQTRHLPSLINIFTVCIKKGWVISYPLGGWPGLSESSLGAHAILLVLSCVGSYVVKIHYNGLTKVIMGINYIALSK